MPEQAPVQPVKVEPGDASASRVTVFRVSKSLLQDEPQSIPTGELVTAPEPAPPVATETLSRRAAVGWSAASMFDTVAPLVTVTAVAPASSVAPPKYCR